MAEARDHRGYFFFGSNDKAINPGVHVWCRGFASLNAAAITHNYQTNWLDFGRLFEEVSPLTIILYGVGYGGTLYCDYYVDRRIEAERTAIYGDLVDQRGQQDPGLAYITWNEGTWDDGYKWMKWKPIEIRYDVDFQQKTCKEFSFKVYTESGNTGAKATDDYRAQIIGWAVEFTANKRRVKPLNTLITPEV
jgi:hypothetical protein